MFDDNWRDKVINEGVKRFEQEWRNEEQFKIAMKEYRLAGKNFWMGILCEHKIIEWKKKKYDTVAWKGW